MPYRSTGAGGGGSGITSVRLTDGTTNTTALTTGAGTFGVIPGDGLTASVSGFDITLSAGGPHDLITVTTAGSPYPATIDNHFILCDVSGGDVDIELPTVAAGDAGQVWIFIDTGSASATDVITLDADSIGGTTINGNATIEINTAHGALNVTTDGTTFFVY